MGDPIVPSDTAWCAPKPGSRPPHDPLLPDREQTTAFGSVEANLWGPGPFPVWSNDVHWAGRGTKKKVSMLAVAAGAFVRPPDRVLNPPAGGGLHAAACGVDSQGVFLGGRGEGENPPERE